MRYSDFREDINYLRAFAVTAVVLFHFEMAAVTSGFVGVDVFFVISGYLMTGIITNRMKEDKFQIIQFLEARFRRIFPALILVVSISIFAEWFITPADIYMKHARQALSAIFFVSNIAFGGDNGYFAQASQTKPLLHTWSLSIEWQFYVLLAIVAKVHGIATKSKSKLSSILIIIFCISFSWCIYESAQDDAGRAYFQLISRAWEMLIGGIFALIQAKFESRINAYKSVHRQLRAFAWLLIVGSCFLTWDERTWPNVSTLIPVIATGIILTHLPTETRSTSLYFIHENGFLSKILHRIGLASYSIYLWHWPIWVIFTTYAMYHGIDVNLSWKLLLIALTLLVSFLSYEHYETSVRKNKLLWTTKRMFAVFSVWVAVTFIFVAFVFLNKGFIKRLPSYAENAQQALVTGLPLDECFRDLKQSDRLPNAHCLIGQKNRSDNQKFIVLGDSLTHQFINSIDFSAQKNNLTGLVVTKSGCRMLVSPDDSTNNLKPSCQKFDSENWEYLKSAADIKYAVVSGGYNDPEEIIKVIEVLTDKMGKKVIFILPTIKINFKVPEAWMHRQFKEDRYINTWAIPADDVTTRKALVQRVESYVHEIDPGGKRVKLVSPMKIICDQVECFLVKNGQSNFRDQEHISNVNSSQYQILFDEAFQWLAKNKE